MASEVSLTLDECREICENDSIIEINEEIDAIPGIGSADLSYLIGKKLTTLRSTFLEFFRVSCTLLLLCFMLELVRMKLGDITLKNNL